MIQTEFHSVPDADCTSHAEARRLCLIRDLQIMRERVEEFITLVYGRRYTIAKFVISGSTAGFVELGLLYVLTRYLGLYYLVSSTVGFVFAVAVSFTLQKFWTFENTSITYIHKQAAMYLGLGVTNLGINAAIMLLLVEVFHLWYLLSQLLACATMAGSNFLIYNCFIFKADT
jgi:dolichol-phosphate mannosyltransferase